MLDAADNIVRLMEVFSQFLCKCYTLYEYFMLLKMPHGMAIAIFCNALGASLAVFAANAGKEKLYWLHSLVLVVLGAFGGGLMAPIFAGRPCIPVANDLVVPACIVTWYLVHHIPYLDKLLTWTPIKFVWTAFIGLFRTHAITNNVTATLAVLTPGAYYPCPLVGPILVGTMVGGFGAFLPFDKGMAPIKNGTPWPIQAAFLSATFYHLMINDTEGTLGIAMRGIFGALSKSSVLLMIGTMQVVHLELQLMFTPDTNLFTPVHKFIYMIFNMKGPIRQPLEISSWNAGWSIVHRSRLDDLIKALRFVVVFLALFGHFYLTTPSVALSAGQSLGQGGKSVVGSCHFMSGMRSCTPLYMQLEAQNKGLRLAVYEGYPSSNEVTDKTPTWTKTIPSKVDANESANPATLSVKPSGKVVVMIGDKEVWASKGAVCGEVEVPQETGSPWSAVLAFLKAPRPTQLVLTPSTGAPVVHCAENAPNQVSFDLGTSM